MFTFPLDTDDLFRERAIQMRMWGIPQEMIDSVRSRIKDNWLDDRNGWTYEWGAIAQDAEAREDWLLASALYGAAKFPVVCTPSREHALAKQVECYLKASRDFPCKFERRLMQVPYRTGATMVACHLFNFESSQRRPIVCLSGGVDTFKMEAHRLALALARLGGFAVAAIDMPGTGESQVPLERDAEQIYLGVLKQLKTECGNGVRTAVWGISFGGLWSAKLAMLNAVDAAIDHGGPVGFAKLDADYLRSLPNGMTGIIANVMGFDAIPDSRQISEKLLEFSLREQGLFDSRRTIAALLVLNGENDQYIRPEDATSFAMFRDADVRIVKGATHCAAEKLPRAVPAVISWLRLRLHDRSLINLAVDAIARLIAPETVFIEASNTRFSRRALGKSDSARV